RTRGEDDVIPVTARKLEALVRLAEASARVRLSDEVAMEDAERAIDVTLNSLEDVGIDPETGEFDIDIIESGHSHSQRERIKGIREIIQTVSEENDEGHAPREEVIEMAEENGIDREKAEEEIKSLKRSGEIMEPRQDYLRLV
ncbi:MAG: AAA family ATPase, partial [Halobacteria archaeon]|nr:AAA family ATPase [Halobacteria archaeon]